MSLSKKYGIEEDKIKQLIRDGWITCSAVKYDSVMSVFEAYRSKGLCISQAVANTAEDTKMGERMIWNIIKKYN